MGSFIYPLHSLVSYPPAVIICVLNIATSIVMHERKARASVALTPVLHCLQESEPELKPLGEQQASASIHLCHGPFCLLCLQPNRGNPAGLLLRQSRVY